VRDILQRPSEFHGQYCRDPLEPDYGSSTVAIIYTDQDKPIIKTHAHGGKKYFLHEEDAPPIEPAAPAQPLELLPTHGKRHPLAQYIDYDLTPRPPSFVIPDLIDAGLVTFAGGHGRPQGVEACHLCLRRSGASGADYGWNGATQRP
jgi:hypothetical protein